MPCRCDDYGQDDSLYRQEADKLAVMLCRMCKLADGLIAPKQWPNDIYKWWQTQQDAARREAEEREKEQLRLKVSALNKLTVDERRALGV